MELGYNSAKGVLLKEELKTIHKKSKNPLHPIFEALMNAFEAINDLQKGEITITFDTKRDLFTQKNGQSETEKFYFNSIKIHDNGIGFNEKEFDRLYTLRDNSKGLKNKGTGRIQFLHYFTKTLFSSVYSDSKSDTGYSMCEFTLSKSYSFLNKNAIIYVDKNEKTLLKKTGTTVTFVEPLDDKDMDSYIRLTAEEMKEILIKHYLNYFCENRNGFPKIEIIKMVNDAKTSEFITEKDIPLPKYSAGIDVKYVSLINNQITYTSRHENFCVSIFLIESKKLPTNNIVLTSKGAEAKKFDIECLSPHDKVDGKRYLVLVSSTYIDDSDSDTRGEINILTSEQYIERNKDGLQFGEVILLDTILKDANKKIRSLCPEIEEKYQQKQSELLKLKEMFLLDDESVGESDIRINDSDEAILRKVYQANARRSAKKDVALKKLLDEAEKINPRNRDKYQQEIKALSKRYIQAVPLQNRTELAQYIARRRILLTCIEKILDKYKSQEKKVQIAEEILHNLIFQQGSADTEDSDLWFISEEYIYYKGVSNVDLASVKLDGKKIFKDTFSVEEKRFLNSLGEKRLYKRPDVLLFPSECKCMIIEFKAPGENIIYHLSQINRYASLIANYTRDEYKFSTFYGYFIGEAIEPKEIFNSGTGDWKQAEHFDFLFRPHQHIYDDNAVGSVIGSLYTEIIKYSTLLERAKKRNKIFIEKLEGRKIK